MCLETRLSNAALGTALPINVARRIKNGPIVVKIMGLVLWMTIVAMEIHARMGFVGVD